MRVLTHTVAGSTVTINVVETDRDAADFCDWVRDHATSPVDFDSETTGLDAWAPGFRVRLAQFGDTTTAWVLRVDRWHLVIRGALETLQHVVVHNGKADKHFVEQDKRIGFTLEQSRAWRDTIIMSKLVDPTRQHSLASLVGDIIDAQAREDKKVMPAEFRRLGLKVVKSASKGSGGIDEHDDERDAWANIPIDNEVYLRYAGLDVVYGARLYEYLLPLVRAKLVAHLATFEHATQNRLDILRRRGLRVDLPYAATMSAELQAESEAHLSLVREQFGLENLNSPKQVAEAFERAGTPLTKRHPKKRDKDGAWVLGNLKTGKEVLLPLAGYDEYWNPIPHFVGANTLAEHIALGKRAEMFSSRYLEKFISLADAGSRIHPDTTGLQARTSRMAVSDPPLQQLPAGDWKVRRAIVADDGMDVFSTDYKQIEMRIVAQLANIAEMKRAILEGVDLHARTAELAYGPDWTDEQRTYLKGAGFGRVFGGGAAGLATKMGLTELQAKTIVQTYDRTYPELQRWSKKLERMARSQHMELRSPTGRILTIDRDRVYASVNYMVQSTAADVMKNALEDIDTAGLLDYVLMPVHDEIVGQASHADAPEVAAAIAEAMRSSIGDIPLDSDADVYGFSWGHGYDKKGVMAARGFASRS